VSPEELRAFLDVVRTSGLTASRIEIPGKLVLDGVGTSGVQPAEKSPVQRDLETLFPGGMLPPGVSHT